MIEREPESLDEAVIFARQTLAELRAVKHRLIAQKVTSTKNLLACRMARRRLSSSRYDVRCHASPAAENTEATRRIDETLHDLFERERSILQALRNNGIYGDF